MSANPLSSTASNRPLLTAETTVSGSAYFASVGVAAGSNGGGLAALHSLEGAVRSGASLSAATAAPSLRGVAVSSSQINLYWNGVGGANGYLIDEWNGSGWTQIANYGSGTSGVAVSGLRAGTTYYFDVGAYSYGGVSWSNYVSVATPSYGPPAAPTLSDAVASSSQVNLSWNGSAGAGGYLIDEWNGSSWTQIANYGSGTTSVAVTGLRAATSYYFIVGAYNSAGVSWSNYVAATTPAGEGGGGGGGGTVDHPDSAGHAYSPVSGSLFAAGGPSYLDIHQGQIGDCWLMASLAEVAARDPADITSMFTYSGTTVENGATVSLYKVRFYNSAGAPQYVTVDTELPDGGRYADLTQNGPLWAALAEKAYAEANGQGIVQTGKLRSDSYGALNEGDPVWALQAITGRSASHFAVSSSNIAADWNAGKLIVLGSSPNAGDNLVVGDYTNGTHAYAVVNYSPYSSNPFELYNPWGVSTVVGSFTPYYGHQVYGGPFYASVSMISKDFAVECSGSGATPDLPIVGNATVEHVRSTVAPQGISEGFPTASTPAAGHESAAKPRATIVRDTLFANWGDTRDAMSGLGSLPTSRVLAEISI